MNEARCAAMVRNTSKYYLRAFSDKFIEGACKLRGVSFNDGSSVVWRVIPEISGGGYLRRYQVMRSVLGSSFGRWEVYCAPH